MNLLIILPRQPHTTGNHVSAKRFATSLRSLGWQVRLLEVAEDEVVPIQCALQQATDVVLLLHAYRSGHPWLRSDPPADLPYAVLMTGTDLNRDLENRQRADCIRQTMDAAAAIIVQNHLVYAQRQHEESPWRAKLRLLPPGIVLGADHYPVRQKLGLHPADLLLLHPASVRPVKGNLELLKMAAALLTRRPDLHLIFCGPALDVDYAARFRAAVDSHPQAHYLGEIPCEAMPDVLRQADLVLNNSFSEGVANALVEAASLGRPILARNIPGNCAVVEAEVNGLLYGDDDEFERQLLRVLDDAELRQRLGQTQPLSFSADLEGERLAAILTGVLAADVGM